MLFFSIRDLAGSGRRVSGAALVALFLAGLAPLPSLAQDAEALPLCARGASAGAVPMAHLLQLEQQDYFARVIERMDAEAFAPAPDAPTEELYYASLLPIAIEWPGVLADRAAELPPEVHDLPWLITLAGIEAGYLDPIYVLTQSTESILSPQLLPIMQRHGLTQEARALRMAMGLFPTWSADPADRMKAVMSYDSQVVDEGLKAALDAAGRAYPREKKGAEAAALRLIASVPAVEAEYRRRQEGMSADQRIDWLMQRLWVECPTDWSTPAEADRAFAAMGSAQAALLMLESLALGMEGNSLATWFDTYEATMSGQIATILALRGETGLADALRQGMAEFAAPFPRDTEARWQAMQAFDDDTYARLDALMPEDSYDRIRAVMIALAVESGLLAP